MNTSQVNTLVIDGGGSKVLYSIGVLKELEKKLGIPLHEKFQLIYSTNTGAIVAALIALGYTMEQVEQKVQSLLINTMGRSTRETATDQFKIELLNLFGDLKFDSFKTHVAMVGLNKSSNNQIIFKTELIEQYGKVANLPSSHDCSIATALLCVNATYPFLHKQRIVIPIFGSIEVIDGGYIANNPSLLAAIDTVNSFDVEEENINIFNVGVGHYVRKTSGFFSGILRKFRFYRFNTRLLESSRNYNTYLTQLILKNINYLRIDEQFPEDYLGTYLFEHDAKKLRKMCQLGQLSFLKNEIEILTLFKNKEKAKNLMQV